MKKKATKIENRDIWNPGHMNSEFTKMLIIYDISMITLAPSSQVMPIIYDNSQSSPRLRRNKGGPSCICGLRHLLTYGNMPLDGASTHLQRTRDPNPHPKNCPHAPYPGLVHHPESRSNLRVGLKLSYVAFNISKKCY